MNKEEKLNPDIEKDIEKDTESIIDTDKKGQSNKELVDNDTDEAEKNAKMAAELAKELENEQQEKARDGDENGNKVEELTDLLKRNMAEFDNYRKRTEKEKGAMFDMGAKSLAEKLLPVVDNFERAIANIPVSDDGKVFYDGIDMIYKQLMKNLEEAQIKPIICVGEKFNPDLHNAVMHIEDESFGENTVAEELQKGYMYKDTVLRYSMVKVAN